MCVQYLLGGLASIDAEDWKKNTELVGYTQYDQVIVWFWKVRVHRPIITLNLDLPLLMLYRLLRTMMLR